MLLVFVEIGKRSVNKRINVRWGNVKTCLCRFYRFKKTVCIVFKGDIDSTTIANRSIDCFANNDGVLHNFFKDRVDKKRIITNTFLNNAIDIFLRERCLRGIEFR